LLWAPHEPLRQWSGRVRVDDHTVIWFSTTKRPKAREAQRFPGFFVCARHV
jgi:hypothetical protein